VYDYCDTEDFAFPAWQPGARGLLA
jgi:hypothetical protein